MRARTSSVESLLSDADDGFDRALHVGLDDHRQFFGIGSGGLELLIIFSSVRARALATASRGCRRHGIR
jgi:hypothetical protein